MLCSVGVDEKEFDQPIRSCFDLQVNAVAVPFGLHSPVPSRRCGGRRRTVFADFNQHGEQSLNRRRVGGLTVRTPAAVLPRQIGERL